MGIFLTTTAIKSKSIGVITTTIIEYLGNYGVGYTQIENTEPQTGNDIGIYKSTEEWTVILWPSYFGINELPTVKYLSEKLDTLVSTVSIYDGESWSHSLYKSGKELDLYNSNFRMPFVFSPSFRLVSWSVNLDVVSKEFDISSDEISCYFNEGQTIKCSISSERADDPWVFTDFWGKVGIKYPIPDIHPYAVYKLDSSYNEKLPK